MSRTPYAAHDPDLGGRSVLVIGLGKSGLAALRLAARRGARVTVADRRSEEELGEAAREARGLGATVHAGGHPASLLDDADLIVVSPGVATDAEPFRTARQLGIPIWGEVELAARHCRGRVIGISGSNGKSTVTSMAGTILRGAGVPGGTGGNLATPFSDLLAEDGPSAVHAVELSSFQLETIEVFSPEVAVLLNLSPDHLDRYPSYEAYAAAKARLLEVQRSDAAAILNADDRESERFRDSLRGRLYQFSTRHAVDVGAWLSDGHLCVRLLSEDEPTALMPRSELALPGEHNVANALAAALACALVGVPLAAIADGLRAYRALPHRLEPVATVRGVAFFNDSKATNPDSAERALQAFPARTVHLILGGKDKGTDWDRLVALAVGSARRVLLVGQAAAMLRVQFAERIELVDCGTVARAVEVGFEGAAPGDTVLLAPGCASFDQYLNFEERGEDFRRAVRLLERREHGDA